MPNERSPFSDMQDSRQTGPTDARRVVQSTRRHRSTRHSILAEATGGVVLAVFVTVVLVALHAQVGGQHGIVQFLGSAELPIVASVLTLDSLREAIGSIYDGEHRQNVFVAGIIVFVVALLLASKGVDMEVAQHHALQAAAELGAQGAVAGANRLVHTLSLALWVVAANVVVWVSAIALSIWNRRLALHEKRHFISMDNVQTFTGMLHAARAGDKVAQALLDDEREAREESEAKGERHRRALDALQIYLRAASSRRDAEA